MIDLSIIIVSYNTKNLLRDCLLSIKNHEPKGINYELIVVDNNSTDGTLEEIENLKLKVENLRLIKNKENLGFAKANNQGMKIAKGKFILLLNSDTEVLEDSIGKMVKFMKERRDAGVAGFKIMNFNGTSQPSTGIFLELLPAVLWLLGGERFGLLRTSPDTTIKTDWISGACFMVRREVLDKVGLLDEFFFMYLEEMEWCYRIKKVGFSIYFYPGAQIIHKSLGSGNRERAILDIYKGLLYFYKKHKTLPELAIIWTLLKLKALVLLIVGFISGNTYLKNTYGKALAIS